MEDIEQLAGTKLGPGTLYGALARLEEDGYIEPLSNSMNAPNLTVIRARALARLLVYAKCPDLSA